MILCVLKKSIKQGELFSTEILQKQILIYRMENL